MKALPRARRHADVPVRAPHRGEAAAAGRGRRVIDFGVGEPREETPAFIREALADALEPALDLSAAEGLPELREAIARWIARRFGVALDPGTRGRPDARLQGGDLPPRAGARRRRRRRARARLPGLRARRAVRRQAGARAAAARRATASCPTSTPSRRRPGARTALLWLNYPNNPTAATAPLALYERAAALAREHDFVLASDEAYSELYFGAEPPVSALQVADLRNVAVLQHAVQALLDARLPVRLRGRRPAS